MDLDPNYHFAIAKAIIEQTNMSKGSDLELSKGQLQKRLFMKTM